MLYLYQILNLNTMYDAETAELQKPNYVDTYLGVEIYRADDGYYIANVWSESENVNKEIVSKRVWQVQEDLDKILAYNYHKALCYIQQHFGHKKDFQNPDVNLENLIEAIKEKINNSI